MNDEVVEVRWGVMLVLDREAESAKHVVETLCDPETWNQTTSCSVGQINPKTIYPDTTYYVESESVRFELLATGKEKGAWYWVNASYRQDASCSAVFLRSENPGAESLVAANALWGEIEELNLKGVLFAVVAAKD